MSDASSLCLDNGAFLELSDRLLFPPSCSRMLRIVRSCGKPRALGRAPFSAVAANPFAPVRQGIDPWPGAHEEGEKFMTKKIITGVAFALATVLASPAFAQSGPMNQRDAYH